MSSDSAQNWTTLATGLAADGTTYKHTGLDPGTTRHYRVLAINAAGTGPASDVAHATTEGAKPGPPRNLQATADGDSAIDLTWTVPADTGSSAIEGYRIDVSSDSAQNWTTLATGLAADGTTYKHTGLDPETTRHYRVLAINAAGTGPASDVAHTTTEGAKPGPPRNLQATADGDSAIDLSWTAPADTGSSAIEGYRIDVSSDSAQNWTTLATRLAADGTTYKHTGLDPGTTRHYRVLAINAAGTGPASDDAHATTEGAKPGSPRNLQATADGDSAIDLTWTVPADTGSSAIEGYRIDVSSDSAQNWTTLATRLAADGTTYKHTGLDPGTTRHYRVLAINAAGTGPASDVAHATTEGAKPGPPGDLEATADGDSAIDLSWTAPADTGSSAIEGYRIDVSSDSAQNWTTLATRLAADGTTYKHTGLDPGTTRHYRVAAINADGTGPASDVAHATTEGAKPGPPGDLEATADGDSAIDLSWTAPADTGSSAIEGYRIDVSSDSAQNWTTLATRLAADGTTYKHTGLDPGTTRHYRVAAINADGTGPASDVAHATTEGAKPGPPRNLQATADGDSAIDLTWTVPADTGSSAIEGYRIDMSSDSAQNWTTLATRLAADGTTYKHTGLDPGTTRHYRVFAINADGTGPASDVAHATTEGAKPGPPRNLQATADGDSAIDLSWTAPADTGSSAIEGYRIDVSSDSAQNWTTLATRLAADGTTYKHTGLDPGTTRHYRVLAINADGTGPASNVAHAKTEGDDTAELGPPRDLQATADGDSAIDLTWTVPADTGSSAIEGYRIDVSSDSAQNWTTLATGLAADGTTYKHTGLDPGTTRHYRVLAINADGTGPASDVAHTTTEGAKPGPPGDLEATADGDSAIDLSWTAPADTGSSAIGVYRIDVSSDSAQNWTTLATRLAADGTTYKHTGLDPETTRHLPGVGDQRGRHWPGIGCRPYNDRRGEAWTAAQPPGEGGRGFGDRSVMDGAG